MEKIIYILIFTAVVFLLTLLYIGFYLHSKIFKRTKKVVKTIDDVRGTYLEEFCPEIFREIDWINSKKQEEVFIKSFDNHNLFATLIENKNEVCIILCHGYHSYGKFDFSCIFKYFYNLGFNLLIIDHRAHGKSEGKYSTFGVFEKDDLLKWIEYINNRYDNKIRIILHGLSMGASTVLYTLGEKLPENVAGAIADSGYISPKDVIVHKLYKKYHLPGRLLFFFINIASIIRNGIWLSSYKTVESLKKCNIPIIFLHGDKDKTVPYNMSIKNYEVVKSKKDILIIHNAQHCIGFLVDKEKCLKFLEDFFKNINY